MVGRVADWRSGWVGGADGGLAERMGWRGGWWTGGVGWGGGTVDGLMGSVGLVGRLADWRGRLGGRSGCWAGGRRLGGRSGRWTGGVGWAGGRRFVLRVAFRPRGASVPGGGFMPRCTT